MPSAMFVDQLLNEAGDARTKRSPRAAACGPRDPIGRRRCSTRRGACCHPDLLLTRAIHVHAAGIRAGHGRCAEPLLDDSSLVTGGASALLRRAEMAAGLPNQWLNVATAGPAVIRS